MKLISFVTLALSGIVFFVFAEELKNTQETVDHSKHWTATKKEAARINPIENTTESIARGRKLYVNSCANCHGNDGTGDGPAADNLDKKPTNLREMAGHHSDGDLAWKIANGRGKMPPLKGMLGKNQIWDLVNYIQSLKTERKETNNNE